MEKQLFTEIAYNADFSTTLKANSISFTPK